MAECFSPAADEGPVLRVKDLLKSYAAQGRICRAVNGISFELKRGSSTVIVGRSGCGKTTLLKLIAALENPDSGTVEYLPQKIRFGFMFQEPRLLPWLTLEDNLRLAFPADAEKAMAAAEMDRVLSLVGLTGWKRAFPRQLSGGMAQRAALARCLCRKPDILLLDEPLSSLDAFTRIRLRQDLDRLWRSLGLSVIFVTHDIEEAVALGDRVFLMEAGSFAGEFSIELEKPRDRRSGEFQEYCAAIESGLNGRLLLTEGCHECT